MTTNRRRPIISQTSEDILVALVWAAIALPICGAAWIWSRLRGRQEH